MAGYSDVSSEFDLQRKRAAQRETANVQNQQDAIKRRLAAAGGGPSGVAIKLDNQVADESARRLGDVNEAIDTGERMENRRVREIKEGRDFIRGEREASQLFSRGEREATQGWQTSERLGSQDFSSTQADLQRKYGSREAELARGFQGKENALNRSLQNNQFLADLGFQREQFRQQQKVDDFNMKLAEKMANEKDFLEKLFEKVPQGDAGFWQSLGVGVASGSPLAGTRQVAKALNIGDGGLS